MKTLAEIRTIAMDDARDYMMGEISTKTLVEKTEAFQDPLSAALYATEVASYLTDGADQAFRNAIAFKREA